MKLLLDQMDHLIAVFKPLCRDTETLVELHAMIHHESDWPKAHYFASRIRTKGIQAIKKGDQKAEAQHAFEEICAQTIHNLSSTKQPFSADTPYWVVPLALKLAKVLGLDAKKVLEIVMS